MKLFKKITSNFKSSKHPEPVAALAVPSVPVVSATAIPPPTLKAEEIIEPKLRDDEHSSSSKFIPQAELESPNSPESQTITASQEEEYQRAIEENIYLKEKNSLLLQLVSVSAFRKMMTIPPPYSSPQLTVSFLDEQRLEAEEQSKTTRLAELMEQ